MKDLAKHQQQFNIKLIALYIFCSAMALACYFCCGYIIWRVERTDWSLHFDREKIIEILEEDKDHILTNPREVLNDIVESLE